MMRQLWANSAHMVNIRRHLQPETYYFVRKNSDYHAIDWRMEEWRCYATFKLIRNYCKLLVLLYSNRLEEDIREKMKSIIDQEVTESSRIIVKFPVFELQEF